MKMTPKTKQQIADFWAGSSCFLDGKPARVTGRRNDFATVQTLDAKGPSVEFAWETVERIMTEYDAAFRS
jgi:hypothetical protein